MIAARCPLVVAEATTVGVAISTVVFVVSDAEKLVAGVTRTSVVSVTCMEVSVVGAGVVLVVVVVVVVIVVVVGVVVVVVVVA